MGDIAGSRNGVRLWEGIHEKSLRKRKETRQKAGKLRVNMRLEVGEYLANPVQATPAGRDRKTELKEQNRNHDQFK